MPRTQKEVDKGLRDAQADRREIDARGRKEKEKPARIAMDNLWKLQEMKEWLRNHQKAHVEIAKIRTFIENNPDKDLAHRLNEAKSRLDALKVPEATEIKERNNELKSILSDIEKISESIPKDQLKIKAGFSKY